MLVSSHVAPVLGPFSQVKALFRRGQRFNSASLNVLKRLMEENPTLHFKSPWIGVKKTLVTHL